MSDGGVRKTYRHRLPVRIMHWINVACLFILLMSGLQVFNAHPALYWGEISNFRAPWLALHGFPGWATIPSYRSLADGRRWHFFFAWLFAINGLAYLTWSALSRHLRRDLWPTKQDWRGMGRSVIEHLRFKHPTGEAATRYNILQRLAYLGVVLVLGPGIVLMGLAMSPHLDSVLGWLVDLVGGRQSARTIHFLVAMAFVAFILIHVVMVLVTGPINQIRAMITGRYAIHEEAEHD